MCQFNLLECPKNEHMYIPVTVTVDVPSGGGYENIDTSICFSDLLQ